MTGLDEAVHVRVVTSVLTPAGLDAEGALRWALESEGTPPRVRHLLGRAGGVRHVRGLFFDGGMISQRYAQGVGLKRDYRDALLEFLDEQGPGLGLLGVPFESRKPRSPEPSCGWMLFGWVPK